MTAREMTARRWLPRLVLGALLVGLLVAGGTALRVWQVARADARSPVDVVVVLGAAQYDGRPSPVLAARLDHARALYRQGVAPRILTVGGSRSGDTFTEAEAGRRYLLERGVPTGAVLAVNEGRDTLRSMTAVAAVARQRGWHSIVIVSDPWHSLRAARMARDAGLEVTTSPTHRGPVVQTRDTQLRYIVRETGALLYYRLSHAPSDVPDTGLG